jgi:DMSO/TMAO reductase YedYZ molybdopterin-dependent catalytic subunit
MADALHPQIFLTYGMNGDDPPVGNGGPLRIRPPRQLGYESVSILHASVRQAIDFGLRSRKEGKQRLRTKSSRDAPYSRSSTWETAFRRAGNRLRKRNKRELYEPED